MKVTITVQNQDDTISYIEYENVSSVSAGAYTFLNFKNRPCVLINHYNNEINDEENIQNFTLILHVSVRSE